MWVVVSVVVLCVVVGFFGCLRVFFGWLVN